MPLPLRLAQLFYVLLAPLATAAAGEQPENAPPGPPVMRWIDIPGTIPLNGSWTRITLTPCHRDPNLYPTHPSQSTKAYHVNKAGQYDASKLSAGDPYCKIGQKTGSSARGRLCLMAVEARHVMLSDFFMDRCGSFYRGFWERRFVVASKSDDHPYLLSRGRVAEMMDRGAYSDSSDGNTYAVSPKDFLFFTSVSAPEMEKIGNARKRALGPEGGFRFDEKSFLFLR